MRTAPKIALSLLLSLLLFSALLAASYAGLFTLLETRFYQPSVTASLEKRLDTITEALDDWHSSNFASFSPFVESESVKRSLLPTQDASDITDRERRAGELLTENPALAGIRIIDSGEAEKNTNQEKKTRRIHFSTFKTDVIKKDSSKISYELYGRKDSDIPYEFLKVPNEQTPRLVMDSEADLFIYSYPFHDAYGTWRGLAVFYVTTGSAVQHLFSNNQLRLSDELHLIHNNDHSVSGVVLDLPRVGKDLLVNVILDRWSRKDFETGRIIKTDDSGWMLVSSSSHLNGSTGQVVSESVFSFSAEIRILFLAVSFLTFFLIIFLLFNLRQDDLLVVRSRIRRFQIQLLQELMETNDSMYPEKLTKELTSRKRDINSQIKKGFARRVRKKHEKEIDELLVKSWDEILTALGQQKPAARSAIDANDIKLMLEEVLQNNTISLKVGGVQGASPAVPQMPQAKIPSSAEPLEELEELDELGEVEELEELDELSEVEDLEELDELGEVEELEELDELGEVEELEELDELGELEELIDYANITDLKEIITDPVEPTEVEYLDGEWEPELLEVATEEELKEYIQETFPDAVLVYNFEETPALDTFERPVLNENECLLDDSYTVGGLDFSILDANEQEDAEEVEYLDPYPSGIPQRIETRYNERAVFEFLEVIGEAEPFELLGLDEIPEDHDQIVNRDGIFVIANKKLKKTGANSDETFQELVDSVLRES